MPLTPMSISGDLTKILPVPISGSDPSTSFPVIETEEGNDEKYRANKKIKELEKFRLVLVTGCSGGKGSKMHIKTQCTMAKMLMYFPAWPSLKGS